jgi:hypothetical protein
MTTQKPTTETVAPSTDGLRPIPGVSVLLRDWERAEGELGAATITLQARSSRLRNAAGARLAEEPLHRSDWDGYVRDCLAEITPAIEAWEAASWEVTRIRATLMEHLRVSVGWCEAHDVEGEWVSEAATRFCADCLGRWDAEQASAIEDATERRAEDAATIRGLLA